MLVWLNNISEKWNSATRAKFFTKKRSGETLVEILVAVFVLTMTATAATDLIIQSTRTSAAIRGTFQSRYLAREAFETLKMIRDTNWIRFADKSCWNINLDAKTCSTQSTDRLVNSGDTSPGKRMSLVMSNPWTTDLHFSQVTDTNDTFDTCKEFDPVKKSRFAIYQYKSADPNDGYNNVLYSTDSTPPADAPVFCRQVTLTYIHADSIQVKVDIAWKTGKESYTSYLMNY